MLNLINRTLSAIFLILFFFQIYNIPVLFKMLIFTISIIGNSEFNKLNNINHSYILFYQNIMSCIFCYGNIIYPILPNEIILPFIFVFKIISHTFVCNENLSIANIYKDCFGYIYTTHFASYALLLYQTELGNIALFNLILSISSFDIGSYIFGKLFGKTKLIVYSPNKTIEGVVGGTISSLTTTVLINDFNFSNKIMYGLIIIGLSLFGDIFESIIKRENNFKDSGDIILGHGGILDRFDSYFFTLPVIYYFYNFFV